jgi:hypothetical protein
MGALPLLDAVSRRGVGLAISFIPHVTNLDVLAVLQAGYGI